MRLQQRMRLSLEGGPATSRGLATPLIGLGWEFFITLTHLLLHRSACPPGR